MKTMTTLVAVLTISLWVRRPALVGASTDKCSLSAAAR